MIKFNYKRFYAKYINNIKNEEHFESLSDMDVFIYDCLEKYDDKQSCYSKFAITQIQNVKIFRELSKDYEHIFPYQLYIVSDYKNSNGKDWLIFVFPEDFEDKYIANHFTFLYNTRSKECDFHITKYDNTDDWDIHFFDKFKDNRDIPEEGFETELFAKLGEKRRLKKYKEPLIDILRYPWKHNLKGGGMSLKKHMSKKEKRERTVKDAALFKCFETHGIETLLVFSFYKNNKYHYSCHIYDEHHWTDRDKTQARTCFYFDSDIKRSEKEIRQMIISSI